MAADIDPLWHAFAAESEEHLETLEELLSLQPVPTAQAGEIAVLFRSFHSLKGLTQAMGLPRIERLAHVAEDVLGQVREGSRKLDPDIVTTLLQTVDRMRVIRDSSVAFIFGETNDPPADGDAGEHDLFDRLATLAGSPPTAHSASPEPPQQPHDPHAAGVDQAPPLSDDEEMLTLYCELIGDQVADLLAVVSDEPSARQRAAETAEGLATGAEVLGLDALSESLSRIAQHANDPRAGASGEWLDQVRLELSQIEEQLSLLAEVAGLDTGADQISAFLSDREPADRQRIVDPVITALSRIAFDDLAALGRAAAAAAAARTTLSAARLSVAAGLLMLVEEQLGRAAQGEIAAEERAIGVAASALATVRDALADGDVSSDVDRRLRDEWQTQLRSEGGGVDMLRQRLVERVGAELVALLGPDQLARLDEHLAGGRLPLEILLDTEADTDVSADVITWLSTSVEVLTSRTVFEGERSAFEFIVLSTEPPELVRVRLAALDAEQRCVRSVRVVSGTAREAGALIAAPAPRHAASPLLRIRVELVDRLVDEISEMRAALGGLRELLRRSASIVPSVREELMRLAGHHRSGIEPRLRMIEQARVSATEYAERLDSMHRRAHRTALDLRVVPIELILSRFPRVVRELAQKLGREVELVLHGEDVRLDKGMAEMLVDPLTHMVRNAIDHGIEPQATRLAAGKPREGRLTISAAERQDGIRIEVRDDGRGLDREAIIARAIERAVVTPAEAERMSDREVFSLLFAAGFTTAAEVTEVSGRGVGLDVVADTVSRFGGTIDVSGAPGRGASFTLNLPVSLTVQNALLLECGERVAIAERDVLAVMEMRPELIDRIGENAMLWHDDRPVPLFELSMLLGYRPQATLRADAVAILIGADDERLALVVDAIPERRELYLRPLHPMLSALTAVAGAAVLGDGSPILLLDARALIQQAREILARLLSSVQTEIPSARKAANR